MTGLLDEPGETVGAEAALALVAATPRAVWLDGVGARAWSGGRSLLALCDDADDSLTYRAGPGGGSGVVLRHRGGAAEEVGDDVLAVLADELAAAPDRPWLGYLGYASRPDLAARVDPAHPADQVPTAVLLRPSRVLAVVDDAPGAPLPGDAPAGPGPGEPGADDGVPGAYAAAFARVQEELRAGNSYEVNLTHRRTVASTVDPVEAYRRLRALNPAPYAGLLRHDVPGARAWLLSSSPERYARVRAAGDGSRTVEARPIKGTTPRGSTPAEDAVLRARLAGDPTYRAENLMIVDLLRHDVAGVAEVGTVRVPGLMEVESYASVHQLVSTVTGRLRPEVSTAEVVRRLFPAGSMTGAPKRRTMEIIAAVEDSPRGAYAGAFGWVGGREADLGVVIRSLTTTGDGTWTLGTGGGITVGSRVEQEWAETRWKVERLLRVLRER